jgi:hypothetical protein
MQKHITLVAVLNLGFGILGVLAAIVLWAIVVGAGFLSGEPQAIRITSLVGTAIAFFLVITSVPGIIGGVALLKRRPWSRILLLIISVLELLNIPLGTALGIYTIWALIQDETKQILESGSSASRA